jgi:hypothetical protein
VNTLLGAYAKAWMSQVIADTEAKRAKEQAEREERAAARRRRCASASRPWMSG